MKKYFIFVLSVLFSSLCNAGAVFTLGYVNDIPLESDYILGHTKDNMTIVSIHGVNIENNTNRYMESGLFLQYGMSSHQYQKRLYNYKEQSLYNFGITMPIDNTFYMNMGGGLYFRHTTLKNGSEKEDERIVNFHMSGYKIIKNRLVIGLSYDTGLNNIGAHCGFKF